MLRMLVEKRIINIKKIKIITKLSIKCQLVSHLK
jgi:hypothetical protein